MTGKGIGAKIIEREEEIARHNVLQRERALIALDRLIRERLASGRQGSIGIRMPYQHGKLGNIREVREDEVC